MNENQENNPDVNTQPLNDQRGYPQPDQAPQQPETVPASYQQTQPDPAGSNHNQQPQPAHHRTSAGVVVLAWLTYAFWAWLIIGIIWLAYIVYANAITDTSVEDLVPYAIAASVVLLPIVLICDRFYRKHDTVKKSGALAIVMIIHAVIFALSAIAFLISTVFTGVSMALDSPTNFDRSLVGLLTTLTATVLFVGVFFKTLNTFKNQKIPKIYNTSMLAVTLLFLILAIAGPAVKSFGARSDRIIESGLPSISNAIIAYARANDKLPESLGDIKVQNEDSQYLLDKNLVEYKIDESSPKNSPFSSETELRYQLCVEYKQAKDNRDVYEEDFVVPSEESTKSSYDSYLSTYRHGAGRQCYKLREIVYNTNNNTSNGIDLYYEGEMTPESTKPGSSPRV